MSYDGPMSAQRVRKKRKFRLSWLALLALGWFGVAAAQKTHPRPTAGHARRRPPAAARSPRAVGIRLVRNLLARKRFALDHGFSYMESCAGYAAARFAASIGDRRLLAAVERRYAVLLTPAGRKYQPAPRQVDQSVFGILPLELFQLGGGRAYRALGLRYANAQWNHPLAGGLSPETKGYLDGAYKLSAVQAHAWQVTHRARYARRSLRELLYYIHQFQRPDGLFWHGEKAHVVWGRGDGWMASALVEALSVLPPGTPGYHQALASYRKLMTALARTQAPDGMWRQVVDDPRAWEESSCTGMFTYALASGLRHGWIRGARYERAAHRGWRALCRDLDARANVRGVCILTEHAGNIAYYLSRPRQDGNLHGQFSMLWAARVLY